MSTGSSAAVWFTLTPIPRTTRPWLASGRTPTSFRPRDDDVVRMPERRIDAELAQGGGHRLAGDERELRPERHRRRRPQEDGHEDCPPGGVLPRAAESAPSRGLVIRHDRRAFRVVVLEQPLRRRARLDVAIRRSEPSAQQRQHGFRLQVGHPD